ncbi:MAG: hypothetical protein M1826_006794 [Phylliscum demangeonii]|nr:MAG: hypothetical protein M1826_006794 [Phylliscum demangeonii]
MIRAGLEYGYVCTGEAFIFLHVPDNPRTVYYFSATTSPTTCAKTVYAFGESPGDGEQVWSVPVSGLDTAEDLGLAILVLFGADTPSFEIRPELCHGFANSTFFVRFEPALPRFNGKRKIPVGSPPHLRGHSSWTCTVPGPRILGLVEFRHSGAAAEAAGIAEA